MNTRAAALQNLETRELTVTSINSDQRGHTVHLSDGAVLTTPLLVGADGKKSLVRSAASAWATRTGHAHVCRFDIDGNRTATQVTAVEITDELPAPEAFRE